MVRSKLKMALFDLKEGLSPLILSLPHSGTYIPSTIKADMTKEALALPDTDWHVERLYDFPDDRGATILKANFSRYVIDLNRSPENETLYAGQVKTGLCPLKSFHGQDLYKTAPDITKRLEKYWQPYHDELARQIKRVKALHGYALLYDAHSIRSTVPLLFEGKLPDLNLGTVDGTACHKAIERSAFNAAQNSSYDTVLNGRFIGGYITRHYSNPDNNVHALQMELAQSAYMDEKNFEYNETRAAQLKLVLENILHAITDNGSAGITAKPVG